MIKIAIQDTCLKQRLDIRKGFKTFTMIYHFHKKEWRLRNATGLYAIFTIEITMLAHKNFKTTIKSWINTEKVHKMIQFNQKAWLKSYIGMNSKLKTEAKNYFQKDFSEYDFWKNYETVRKHRGIKLLTKSTRRSYLVSELAIFYQQQK